MILLNNNSQSSFCNITCNCNYCKQRFCNITSDCNYRKQTGCQRSIIFYVCCGINQNIDIINFASISISNAVVRLRQSFSLCRYCADIASSAFSAAGIACSANRGCHLYRENTLNILAKADGTFRHGVKNKLR